MLTLKPMMWILIGLLMIISIILFLNEYVILGYIIGGISLICVGMMYHIEDE